MVIGDLDYLEVEGLEREEEDRLKVGEEGKLKVEEKEDRKIVDQPKVLRAVKILLVVILQGKIVCPCQQSA